MGASFVVSSVENEKMSSVGKTKQADLPQQYLQAY